MLIAPEQYTGLGSKGVPRGGPLGSKGVPRGPAGAAHAQDVSTCSSSLENEGAECLPSNLPIMRAALTVLRLGNNPPVLAIRMKVDLQFICLRYRDEHNTPYFHPQYSEKLGAGVCCRWKLPLLIVLIANEANGGKHMLFKKTPHPCQNHLIQFL